MKRRYSYVLLFAAPALLASVIVSVLLFGAVAGGLWLFVLGDARWPPSIESTLSVLFVPVCAALWLAFLSLAYLAGKKQEGRNGIGSKPLTVSASATALLALLIVWHQWSVGNIGTKSDGALCSEYCGDKGYASSGTPPRNSGEQTCSCFDAQGREAVKVPIASLR